MSSPLIRQDATENVFNVSSAVVQKPAAKSFDKSGKIINENRSPLQLKIGDIADDRLLIAIKNPELKDGEVKQSFLDKRKFVPLKLTDDKTVLVSIASLAARLHLSEKEINKEYMNDGYLNTALINKRAAEVKNKLAEYDNIIAQNSPASVTALKISQKEFEKVVRIAVTQDLDKAKKIKAGSLFNRVKFIAARDETDSSKSLLLLTKVKVLGHGSFAKVSEFRNLASAGDSLVTKRATENDSQGEQIYNEVSKLNYLWKGKANGSIVGIQPPPKSVFNFSDKNKVGFITEKHDGDLEGIMKTEMVKNVNVRQDGALQLLKGLVYMQEKNLVHGDIKPDNIGCKIQRDANGQEKLQFFFADFGGASTMKEMNIREDKSFFEGRMGTVYTDEYNCPNTVRAMQKTAQECYTDSEAGNEVPKHIEKYKELQFKRDVYATGLTLYTLLTGVKGLPPEENGSLNVKKIREDLVKAGIDQKLIDVVMGMVDPDPEKRITSKQALELFKKVLESQPSQVLEQSSQL